jgi:hypothetical protein
MQDSDARDLGNPNNNRKDRCNKAKGLKCNIPLL